MHHKEIVKIGALLIESNKANSNSKYLFHRLFL